MHQLDLFTHISGAYASADEGTLTNESLYRAVADRTGMNMDTMNSTMPIGKAGAQRSIIKRAIRWYQQDLRAMGVIEKVPEARGIWRLTEEAGRKLNRSKKDVKMIAFSTTLGVAIWGSNESIFQHLDQPIMLAITSPPYPLRCARAYGNVNEAEFVDFLVRSLEPVVKRLAPEGSLVLNVSQDIFLARSPARSTYNERLVLALQDRLGLHLMDRFIWNNPSKPPGPIQWASKQRIQTNVAYEPIYWFAADPLRVNADNRRVLKPHSPRHLALVARGGEQRQTAFGDGAYRLKNGSFGNPTEGAIPRNVLTHGHQCADSGEHRRHAISLGFPPHGAPFPSAIPNFFVQFLTQVDQLVVDLFSGTGKTALAAERLGRRWLTTENILDYIRPSAELFRGFPGFEICPAFESIRGRGGLHHHDGAR